MAILPRALRLVVCAAALALLGLAVRHDRLATEAEGKALARSLGAMAAKAPATPRAVCEALDQAGPAGLRVAFQLLDDPTPHVRAGAAVFLGLRCSRRAVPHLIRLLRDPDPSVRCAAASALGAIGDPKALPFLRRAMTSDCLAVAEAALRAAQHIQAAQDPPADG